jgi:hypothetical protein
MSQTLEQERTQTVEGIGLNSSTKARGYTNPIPSALRTASPEAVAKLRDPLSCGHPRACLYPDYCPPDQPGWKSRTDVFCTACAREGVAVTEARSEAFEEAYQECWVSRNSDEIADAILSLIMDDEKS